MVRFLGFTRESFLNEYMRLYHYLSLDYLDDTLLGNSHYFMNPMKWKDPYERYYLNPKYAHKESGRAAAYLPVRNRVFCKCFTTLYQCEPYWDRHSDCKTVCLKFNTEALLEELDKLSGFDVYIGKVKYVNTSSFRSDRPDDIDFNDIFPSNPGKREMRRSTELQLRLLLLKRVAFNYEKEIRIFILPKEPEPLKDSLQIGFSCSANELVKSLTFAPGLRGKDFKPTEKYRQYKKKYESEFGIDCYLSKLLYESSRMNGEDKVIYYI